MTHRWCRANSARRATAGAPGIGPGPGGVPTIGGAWLGGFTYAPVWSVLFLALGVGAIAQVSVQILRQVAGDRAPVDSLTRGPVVAGLAAGFAIMYVTGMLIG